MADYNDTTTPGLLYGRNPYAPANLPGTFAPPGLLGGGGPNGAVGGGFGGGGILGGGGVGAGNGMGGGGMNPQTLALAGRGLSMLSGYGKSLFGGGSSGMGGASGIWRNPDTGEIWGSGGPWQNPDLSTVWTNPDTGAWSSAASGVWQNPDLYGGMFSSGADAGLGDAAGSFDWGSLYSAVG